MIEIVIIFLLRQFCTKKRNIPFMYFTPLGYLMHIHCNYVRVQNCQYFEKMYSNTQIVNSVNVDMKWKFSRMKTHEKHKSTPLSVSWCISWFQRYQRLNNWNVTLKVGSLQATIVKIVMLSCLHCDQRVMRLNTAQQLLNGIHWNSATRMLLAKYNRSWYKFGCQGNALVPGPFHSKS